jgi:hypothetical protein
MLLVAAVVGISVSDHLGRSSGTTRAIQGVPGSVPETSQAGGANRGNGLPNQSSDSVPGARAARNAPYPDQGFREMTPSLRPTPKALGGYASSGAIGAVGSPTGPRKVAQNVDLVLSTEPQDVRDVSDGVVGVVDKYNGFVVSSNVTSGHAPGPTPVPMAGDVRGGHSQQGSGSFKLRIPAQHLQAALADMSKLAHVSSRTEGTQDITKRFDSAKARVHDLETQRAQLLRQLADAFTISERQSLKARLAVVENQLADARDHYGHVQQRIHLVPVTVEVQGQQGVDSGGGGSWSIGDAFHDAGRVLTVMAGILLISAAVLAPLGLIGGLAWLMARAVIRRRREDALE